ANPALLPKQLASVLSITAPNLTTLLDKFEQQGWACRLPNPEDGRSQLVHLTPSGRALATRWEEVGADMAAQGVARLSQAESQLLNRLLIKLYGASDAPTSDVTSDVTSE
ncbi:MAG: MarR family transcriptional regulator, partial [Burkholderiaceae bacterium]